MGWFDEQIEYRKRRENELLTDSFQNIAKSVSGHRIGEGLFEEDRSVSDAISQLLRYFGVKEKEVPAKLTGLQERLDYLLASTGILYRETKLTAGWQNDAMGAMIGTLKEGGAVITILPGEAGGFVYVDPHTGVSTRITKKTASGIGEEAYCFYRPFPMRKMSALDLWRYMSECLTKWDLVSFGIASGVITLVGMLTPLLYQILIGDVVTYGSETLLGAVMIFMLCAAAAGTLFGVIRALLLTRIGTKLSVQMSAATMMRVLSLPADFFRNYSTGELTQYLTYMNSICSTIVNSLFAALVTGVLSLMNLFLVVKFARSLLLPSVLVTLLTLGVSMMSASIQTAVSKEQMQLAAKEKGLVFSLINGIQEIRLAGAEKRVFAKWANAYAGEAELTYNPPAFLKLSSVITTAISLAGTIVIYWVAVTNGVSVAEYYAFNSSYAYISAAFASLATVATTAATIRPGLELLKPLMEAEPEVSEGLETVTRLSGAIELSHVSFRYDKDGPWILDDLSVSIPARQYVAIVGKTGCGKSTLLRLLLGFETPTSGTVTYDRKDTRRLDMGSVRKRIGTVTQDGKLFQGSIYENITISAPDLTMDQAWEAAEMAGIAEDIRRMPMGMHTVIADGAGGISGGQKQRLMIARAVAPRPKILFLDEATSALDNITQRHVAEALDGLKCTRIVIAHRLSTIRHCDRILVLDRGKIIEDGTYEELIAAKGFFAELVERQRV